MRTYKVIALTCTGRGGKIFRHGDELNENQFHEGHAEHLVKQKFLERLTGDASEEKSASEIFLDVRKDEDEPKRDEKKIPTVDNSEPAKKGAGEVTKVAIDDISKKELIKYLTDEKIEFDGQSSKQDLYKLYAEN